MSRTLNIEAEQAVLATLLRWPDSWDSVGDSLRETDFANKAHRVVFTALHGLIAACKPVDAVSLHDAINGDTIAHPVIPFEDISNLANLDVRRGSVRRYTEIVRKASLERQILAAVEDALQIAEGDGELQDRLERVTALFSGMSHGTTRKLPRTLADIAVDRIDHYTALSQGEKKTAWPTHIPSLDRLLAGGLRPGKVYVLAARPKVGKTGLAAQIVLNGAKYDDTVALVLTQEMPDEEIADRSIANLGHVDYTSIQTGKFAEDDWGRLCEGVEIAAKLPVWIDDQAGLTLADIRTKARSIKGLKVLVLDYLQLCSGSTGKKDANRNSEIEQISRGVKTLAKELGIAVLMLSQLNRAVEMRQDKRPHLSDLRDSGAIEQDADAVIFLWPVRDFENRGHRLIGCAVEANRSGPCGEFGLDTEGRYQRWAESDQDIKAQASNPIARGKKGFSDA